MSIHIILRRPIRTVKCGARSGSSYPTIYGKIPPCISYDIIGTPGLNVTSLDSNHSYYDTGSLTSLPV